ncbi:DUF317 domain-containing protein [Streptomyces phaeochromogenes]|uniref:DUF317 domain-containing protein n=1 Tax=Streptomyces phaeochromogenes TaxID=1923 RepID=UPI002DDB5BDC|nr:DUF317 domain-containing protein [Streptomyces phaeochromogenes]WRZ34699.1 DUF317 domain-containing protein [Streptomyces phaeochromogenes]
MPHPQTDLHLHLDLLHGRSSAVTATITGTPTHTLRALLALHGFEALDDTAMVMARIDREEAHYADQTARAVRTQGVTVDITPRLREEIDTEWTWGNYPMPWCSREEIREVSADAQKIYDDIRSSRLIIHAHAHDGWTIVAVGTYRDGPSIHLHGENHLRVEAGRYDEPATAIAEFERLYGDAVRPGPAPATDTEREAEQARTPSAPGYEAGAQPPAGTTDSAEVDAASADDHEALLNDFLKSHGAWEKCRTWSDTTTHAVHESLVLRAEFVHEAEPSDAQWKIAAYESPIGERRWHANATTTVPVEIMRVLLDSLASSDAAEIAAGSQVSEATIGEATRPVADAGWKHTIDGRWIRWQLPGDHPITIQFDAFASQAPHTPLDTWTIWAGLSINHPTWTIHASAYTPAGFLSPLAGELAHGIGTRRTASRTTVPSRQHSATLPLATPQHHPSASRR